MHFIHKIQCFEEFLQYFALIFKKLFFPEFRPIESVFWPIEIVIKSFGLALCVSIDRTYFSINRKSYREFFKKLSFSLVLHYSNFFQNSFSPYSIGPRVKASFLSCSTKILQGFLSSKAGKTFIPLIFLLFSDFMHFCHAFGVIFEPKGNWDFLWFKLVLWKLINGFLLWANIKLFLVH